MATLEIPVVKIFHHSRDVLIFLTKQGKEEIPVVVTHGDNRGNVMNLKGDLISSDRALEILKKKYGKNVVLLACHEESRQEKFLNSIGEIHTALLELFEKDQQVLVLTYTPV